MKKQHILTAYILIGVGVYFLIKQLNLSLFANFYSWSSFLIIFGVSLLIYSFTQSELENVFPGIILLGLGIHFHGLENYEFWFDHWSVFFLIVGLAYLGQFIYTKKGLINALILIGIALLMIFSVTLPSWFQWIYGLIDFLETFWPVALILIGFYILIFKKEKKR